jgi:hypothetical protein
MNITLKKINRIARINRIVTFALAVSKDHYPVYPDHPGNPVKFFECYIHLFPPCLCASVPPC